ncbi:MAG: MFS transporter [Nocardiopsaceae bacterium]|jgi:MFS family permease|nr:MFS transporter [Nocardiopsaceae bacterium]
MPAAPPRPAAAGRHGLAFWLVGYAFLVTMAFSSVPTPLYVLYQARDGFGALMVTVIFAAYAAGVIASLFLVGHLSDWLGRRRMVAAAVAVNMASGAAFLFWPSVPGLLTGRVISGISIGMLTATATAYLGELHAAAHPEAGPARAEMVATAANLGGLGAGPLLAGFLAQYAPDPLRLPYLVAEALMLAGAIGLALAPETAPRPQRRPPYRPQRVSVPSAHRPVFFAAGLVAAASFALFGLFTSLSPSVIAGLLHDRSHALAGSATFAVFAAGALAQLGLSRAPVRRQLGFGLAGVAAGLALVTAAAWLPSLALLLTGGVVAGAGAGALFRGSVSAVAAIAPAGARGESLAGLFLAGYAGLAVPVVALGFAAQALSARDAVIGFAAVLAVVIAPAGRRLLRHGAVAAGEPAGHPAPAGGPAGTPRPHAAPPGGRRPPAVVSMPCSPRQP